VDFVGFKEISGYPRWTAIRRQAAAPKPLH
jgi:hypothetical protein